MTIRKQVEIMEKLLSNYDRLLDKMDLMHLVFDCDPEYSKEARGIVRGNIAKDLKV